MNRKEDFGNETVGQNFSTAPKRKLRHLFKIEIEERKREIYMRIETKAPLDAVILAHAAIFSEAFKTPKEPDLKVLP